MDHNQINLIGRVVRDAEFKLFSTDSGVCSFSVATGEKWKDKSGADKESVQYHYCKMFGKMAEKMSTFLLKGQSVFVQGKVLYEEYTDAKNVKHHVTVIKVDPMGGMILLGGKKAASSDEDPAPRKARTAPKVIDDEEDIPF